MKRVSLITIFDNINFGTYLQTVAQITLLKDRGCDVEVIKYVRKPYLFLNQLRDKIGKTRNPIRIITRSLRVMRWLRTRNRDWSFVKRYAPLSRIYSTYADLCQNPPKADIYLTGSDQVWNSFYNNGIDKAYYLAFAPNDKKLVAYSASIGMDDFPENEKKETLRLLKRYSHISVRERRAKDILESIGLNDIPVTLDPTLMLNKDRWCEIIGIKPNPDAERYLLIYSVEYSKQDEIIRKAAQEIAEKLNLKIYSVSFAKKCYSICDRSYKYATPSQFIELILNSSYMVVSSFHGTAFAINFNKPFITVAPGNFSSRIDSILSICNLRNRKISNAEDQIHYDTIDYTSVNGILDEMRVKSSDYLDLITQL